MERQAGTAVRAHQGVGEGAGPLDQAGEGDRRAHGHKERARSGETKTRPSRTSTRDLSSGRRGGLRSGTNRPKGRTKEQLYSEAKRMNISGRSRMNKQQLQRAVDRRK
jgi:hypothetical protein